VLCLAPDIPLDQISVIYPGNLFRELGWWGKGYPYWTREEGLSAGAWAKFEDQAVIGWNGVVDRLPDGLLYLENKSIVYQGDVWISVGQALRYGSSTLEGEFPNAADVFFIQLTFEGMEDLLGIWDHLALKNPLHLEICDGIGFQECDLRRDLTGSVRTDLNVQSDGGRITRRVYAEDSAQDSLTAWVRIGDLNGESFFTDYRTWRVDILPADEGHGSRHAACEPGACIPADASYFYDNGQPYDRDEGRFFQEDLDIPIIPFGQEARGFRIVDAEFLSGQLLRAYGLDISLQERDLFDPPNSKWLIVEVESTGDPGGFTLLRDAGSGWYLRPMQREAGYGTSAGYRVAGNAWDSVTRAATSHVLIVGKVPNSWQMQDLLLAADAGPAWRLR